MPRKMNDHRAAMLARRVTAYRADNPNASAAIRDLIIEADSYAVHVFIRWTDFEETKIRYSPYFGAYEMFRDVTYRMDMRSAAYRATSRGDHLHAGRFAVASMRGDESIGE